MTEEHDDDIDNPDDRSQMSVTERLAKLESERVLARLERDHQLGGEHAQEVLDIVASSGGTISEGEAVRVVEERHALGSVRPMHSHGQMRAQSRGGPRPRQSPRAAQRERLAAIRELAQRDKRAAAAEARLEHGSMLASAMNWSHGASEGRDAGTIRSRHGLVAQQ